MELTSYIDRVHQEVAAATALAGPEAAGTAERLLLALDPAIRLVLLEALSDAAAEISAAMPTGNVDTRLRGREVTFVVEGMQSGAPDSEPVRPGDTSFEEIGDQVRLTLRLSESLKARAEELSNELGQSLNAWLVDAVRGASSTRGSTTAWPAPPQPPQPPRAPGSRSSSKRQTGWA